MSSPAQPSTNGSHSSSTPPLPSTAMPAIKINPQRASDLAANLSSVSARISSTAQTHSLPAPRLVAVSKLKPASDILALHHQAQPSQSHFGENYVQELLEKSKLLPRTIKWHMIGGLQSNKARELAREVPNLWAVESVDSVKKAGLLEKGRAEMFKKSAGADGKEEHQEGVEEEVEEEEEDKIVREKLRVFVQVNTSGEESKSGVDPQGKEMLELCSYIRDECPHLKLQGLMTIGAIARSQASTPESVNEDFVCLKEARDRVVSELGVSTGDLELSMGMSEDFGAAIAQGSSEVRVGSTIFGVRPPKSEAKVLDEAEQEKR